MVGESAVTLHLPVIVSTSLLILKYLSSQLHRWCGGYVVRSYVVRSYVVRSYVIRRRKYLQRCSTVFVMIDIRSILGCGGPNICVFKMQSSMSFQFCEMHKAWWIRVVCFGWSLLMQKNMNLCMVG